MKRRSALALLTLGLLLGVGLTASLDWQPTLAAQDVAKSNKLKKELAQLEKSYQGFNVAFEKVAQLARPSVVRVVVDSKPEKIDKPKPRRRFRREDLPEGFRRFFEWRFPEGMPDFFKDMPRHFRRHGLGSGIIIDPKGYILTNNHVVKGFKDNEIRVFLFHQKTGYVAKVKGQDPKSDLAVIKIDAGKPLPALTFADSSKLKVGEWVIAVGHPFEYMNSVSAGIISATGRTDALRGADPNAFKVQDFIQTDAAINPGNSGGPLVDLRGEIVGINTFIASQSGGFQGLGFAVPSNIAKKVARSLITKGKVVRGYLGVSISDVCDLVAEQLGLKDAREMVKKLKLKSTDGAFVHKVMPDTPAAKGGLEPQDVILAFDGKPVKSRDDLTAAVRDTEVGKTVVVKVMRQGKQKTLKVKIAEQPEEGQVVAKAAMGERGNSTSAYGMTLQTLTPDIAKRLGMEGVKGVLVTEVEPGSPAAKAEIEANDVIISVGLTQVSTVKELMKRFKEAEELDRGIAVNVKGKGMIILK